MIAQVGEDRQRWRGQACQAEKVNAKARGREQHVCLRDGRKARAICLLPPQCGRHFAFLCLISTEAKTYQQALTGDLGLVEKTHTETRTMTNRWLTSAPTSCFSVS